MRINFQSSTSTTLSAIRWAPVSGRPLSSSEFLLVHGLASNAETWRQVGEHLADRGAHVIALDQRSHGRSEFTNDGFDFQTLAADLAHVLEQAGMTHPVVAGQSWGGNVAVEFASRYRPETKAVVGIDGGHIRLADRFATWEDCARALAPPEFAGAPATTMRERIAQMHPDWSSTSIEATMNNFRIEEDKVYPILARSTHMLILQELYLHDPALALMAGAPSLLVLAGEKSGFTDPGFDRVEVIAGDHDLHLQYPARISAFLEEMST